MSDVPSFKMNIVSTGKLDDEDYMCEFSSRQYKLNFESKVVAVGHRKFTLYKCHLNVAK